MSVYEESLQWELKKSILEEKLEQIIKLLFHEIPLEGHSQSDRNDKGHPESYSSLVFMKEEKVVFF